MGIKLPAEYEERLTVLEGQVSEIHAIAMQLRAVVEQVAPMLPPTPGIPSMGSVQRPTPAPAFDFTTPNGANLH